MIETIITIAQVLGGLAVLGEVLYVERQHRAEIIMFFLSLICVAMLYASMTYWVFVSQYYVPHPFYDGIGITSSILLLAGIWMWYGLWRTTKK